MVIVALSKGLHFASHLGHTRMSTALLRSQRANGGRADCAEPTHRYVHAPEPRRSFLIRAGARVGGSVRTQARDRQAPIFRCRTQVTRLAPASTTPAVVVPMMTPARTSKGKCTPR